MAKKKSPARAKNSKQKPLFWVGIGASAGGLEALRGLVRNLASDLPATFIVAQHMAPHHRSMLSEIIGRETSMVVRDVTDKLVPEPNTIYITPPNFNVIADKNKIHLVEPSREPASPKPSVDVFLNSLAEELGPRSVAVILSGTGSDGAEGVISVRKAGGITIAQDELTAKYSSMPVTAIETGCVDLVMSPEEIGVQFAKVVAEPRDLNALRSSALDNEFLSELVQLLLDRTKVNFRHYKTATFQRRVERRMAAHGVSDLQDYLVIARTHPNEVEALFDDLLITVTSFFRDPLEFESLSKHVKEIVEAKKGEQIRVWVPGTATGEEAYTIAILFAEAMGGLRAFEDASLQIFATDIETKSIETARRAYYPQTSMDAVPEEIVEEYFETAPAGYMVKKDLREKIVFSIHNIAQDPPFLNLDLISCRNLLIYFQTNLQAQVFARFHYAMVPKGVLFLGKSETTSSADSLFRVASPEKHIFYQRPSRDRKPLRDPVFGQSPTLRMKKPKVGTAEYRDLAVASSQFDSLVAALGPDAVLMDSDLRIRKAFGNLQRYVGLQPGNIDTSAMTLLNEPYRQDIRAAVPGAIRKKTTYKGIARVVDGKPGWRERIMVYPIDMGPDDETRALVVFNMWEEKAPKTELAEPITQAWQGQVDELSRELEIARTNLQQTVEELETSNEELQALNEELQSSNEELQSTNEELETSNEELQSTNEELTTVNEELQVSSHQVKVANQNLRSILDNVSVPMLVVDCDLNITNASRASSEFFGVSPDLVLPHVSRCRVPHGFPSLVALANDAIDQGRRVDQDIQNEETSAILSVVPHYSASDDLIGAIIVLTDNTAELKRTRDELQLIFDNMPVGMMVRDPDGTITKANRVLKDLSGAEAAQLSGGNVREICTDETAEMLCANDTAVIESGRAELDKIREISFRDGRSIWIRSSVIPVRDPHNGRMQVYAMAQDVTEDWNTRKDLALTEKQLGQAVRAAKIALWELKVKTGKLTLSDRYYEMFGIERTEDPGKVDDMQARIHPEDRELVREIALQHVENGTPYQVVFRMRHEDGRYLWVESHGAVSRDENGEPEDFVGTITDVTERRFKNWALQERTNQLSMASSMAAFGYWRIDLNNDVVTWSDQVYVLHGVTAGEHVPTVQSGIDFYHPDDRARVRELVTSAIEDGKSFEFEARLVRADGEIRNVRAKGRMDEDGENNRSLVGVIVDITDKAREEHLRMTLEELSRSNEELNRFSYVCSHDMKEPVRMIENMSKLLLEPAVERESPEGEELLKRIGNNAIRLRGIIDSLLAYSRIEAKVEMGKVDLNEVIRDVKSSLAILIEDTQPEIAIDDLPTVWGARVHFTQLFQNLIGNALKFTAYKKKKPSIRINANKRKKEWVFTIQDNGPGIPREHRGHVFSLFSRLHLRDEIEGTGLGLSICQSIVSQYGGTIACDDSEMGGALFEIRLPVGEIKRASAEA